MVSTNEQLSVLLSNLEARAALAAARAAQEVGFRRVWIADTPHVDPAALGGAIASGTTLEVGTAVIGALHRTPAALATMVGTWARLAGDGRAMHLGLGATGATIVEGWHGLRYERPAEAMGETLAIVRQALAGERTSFAGSVLRSHGFRLQTGAVGSPVRVYLGALGPRMRALAARETDGLIMSWATAGSVGAAAAQLARDGVGRAPRLIVRVYVDVGGDAAAVRAAVGEELVQYVMSPPYARMFGEMGFAEEVAAVHEAFARGSRADTAAATAGAMTDEFLLSGSPAEVRARIDEYLSGGADEVALQPVAAFRGGDPERTVRALGPRRSD